MGVPLWFCSFCRAVYDFKMPYHAKDGNRRSRKTPETLQLFLMPHCETAISVRILKDVAL